MILNNQEQSKDRNVLPTGYRNRVLDLYFGLSLTKDIYRSRKSAQEAVRRAEKRGYDVDSLEWITVDSWSKPEIEGWLKEMQLEEKQINDYLAAYNNGHQ